MKVLVRHCNDIVYEWKEATYDGNLFWADGHNFNETDIVSIMEDDRSNKVRCSVCGEMFEKNSPEFEAHKHAWKDSTNCYGCYHLSKRGFRTQEAQYELLPDGKYMLTDKSVGALHCSWNRWNRPDTDINSEVVRNNCYKRRCEVAQQVELTDIFTENPGIFDHIITVDKIIAAGYKEMRISGNNAYYLLKGRNTVEAVVNKLGLVDHFDVHYYSNCWRVVYSKSKNKFYEIGSRKYQKFNPYNLPSATQAYIESKIRALYE